ncbi:hypothetical protein HWV62_27182 [Athelia sp. TMB]|nr:hypothetical protein HWV62_37767 [Athelia sp. TMB]KAF7982689.1 hypothetical protein HWV62_27182 [Athelia sp. TMB]
MGDHLKPHSPRNQSFIPVVTPRATRSGLPNSFSATTISLPTPIRRPSISSPSVADHPGSHNPPGSSSSSFRSLRNLLPFGNGGKQQASSNPNSGVPNGSKNPFSSFGSVRRSMTTERKTSATLTRHEEPEPSPVIAIEPSSYKASIGIENYAHSRDTGFDSAESVGPPSAPIRDTPEITRSTGPPTLSTSPSQTPGDLSTIIEAETSGISKHLPDLDESRGSINPRSKTSSSSNNKSPMAKFGNSYIDMESGNCSDSSVLELDSAQLKTEVMDAILAKDDSTADAWLNTVNPIIVDETRPPSPLDDSLVDKSFNLDSLDPDLAALLSPHNINSKNNTVFGKTLAPSPFIPSPSASPRRIGHAISRANPGNVAYQLATPKVTYKPELLPAAAESSPAHRRSASLSKPPDPQRPVSLSALPRLARSVTASPYYHARDIGAGQSVSPQTSPEASEFGRRSSVDQTRRHQPPSPLSTNPVNGRRPTESRLVTPARRTASYSVADTGSSTVRPPLRHLNTANSGSNWDANSRTPSSQASSSASMVGTARRRLHSARGSIDQSHDPQRTYVRHRKRSMSLSQQVMEGSPESASSYRGGSSDPLTRPSSASSARRAPAAEWLGPRTAKAFAAAGLLDHEKTVHAASASSTSLGRYGSIRGGPEHDPRTQYNAPSRVAFSEASGSTSSWGRSRSASRTLTMSDAGGALIESPTFSLPRTSSTAPTSISTSPHLTQASANTAMQSMVEKHSLETEALLSALADSQRAAKSMREENVELRSRIQDLEGVIFQMRQQWRSVSPQPPSRALSRAAHDRVPQHPPDFSRRTHSHHTLNGFLHPNAEYRGMPSRETSPNPFKEAAPSHRRRFSTTSSNFHLPPSNMSMLMQEADLGAGQPSSGGFSSPSGSPPSPTLVMPKRGSGLRHAHQHKRSMSSGNTTSPTTANFSMTGSPGSLHLRPEHEMHLGDMTSLDLALASEDSGEDNAL